MQSAPQAPSRVAFLDYLRVLGMMMVVGVHALGRTQLSATTEANVAFIVSTVAVPIFFLADGFLFAYCYAAAKTLDSRRYLIQNVYRLIIPWVCFSVFYVCLRLILESQGILREQVVIGQGQRSLFTAMYLSLVAPQMYFLLSLFVVRSLVIFHKKLLNSPVRWSLLVFVAYTTWFRSVDVKSYFLPGADPVLLAAWGLQYFLAGMVLYKVHGSVTRYSAGICVLGLTIVIVCRLLCPNQYAVIQYSYLIGVYALGLLIAKRFPSAPKLAQYNMGIYLLHYPIVISLVSVVVARVVGTTNLVSFVGIVSATYGLSALVTKGLISTPYLRVVLGERVRSGGAG